VAAFWDAHVGDHLGAWDNWEANGPVIAHQNRRISGDELVTPVDWFWRRYGPFIDMANIGSGTGNLEQHVAALMGPSARIVGHDISPVSVAIARQNCRAYTNVTFVVADLNVHSWPTDAFDAIFANGALHHVERLDFCLGQVRRALRPRGVLFVNDYIGPNRFQWSDVQMRLADELLATVPSTWVLRPKVMRFDADQIKSADPSEAVCSQFIEDAVRAHFTVLERKERGGTLLMPIFGSGCLSQRMLESRVGLDCLRRLAVDEECLIDAGVIRGSNVVLVGRARE